MSRLSQSNNTTSFQFFNVNIKPPQPHIFRDERVINLWESLVWERGCSYAPVVAYYLSTRLLVTSYFNKKNYDFLETTSELRIDSVSRRILQTYENI